jgi:hypothetical protein
MTPVRQRWRVLRCPAPLKPWLELWRRSERLAMLASNDSFAAEARAGASQLRANTERSNGRKQKRGDSAWQLPDRRQLEASLTLPLSARSGSGSPRPKTPFFGLY